ncbi:hypothetical protein EN780_31880 [Mesorhizobium sp. M4B.F.Ca.ET.089.01.1.1]|uniref:hypothetical protein n=1 Tax=Mesorhizobium sp. M4B.F.Ca.ET.089.01.1.1 TaxID=2496662 RepID=UPI000FE41B2F|nr:hypothetical protein [Mesorhizobium sp. M4B.F.Ca.ET.089.01.1.1]RWX60498.1 hypothetical protein EN780_31880 [Mesorhizobium sp. M4B.F.Ca.ET.089.01.1.1]
MLHPSTTADDNGSMLARLKAAHAFVAGLVVEDAIYAPIFTRLEAEIAAEEARGDPIAKARAIVAAQRAIA